MESVWFATHPSATTTVDTFVEGVHVDSVVAGGGLTGLTTAVLLARAGQKVVVLEARHVGAVTTGNTTAKVSLLQGLMLSGILDHHSKDVVGAYVEAQREGQAWLVRLLDDRGVPYERRAAYTYATGKKGLKDLRSEMQASRDAGLEVAWTEETELPFAVRGAITVPDQVQIHPLLVLDALLEDFAAHGGVLVEDAKVTDADSKSPVTVTTTRGRLTAERLILATGTPILDRGGYFAKLVPQRSYATTYHVPGSPGSIPRGMYLSVDDPTRSLRTVPINGDELLMVGGNGHVGGRFDESASAAVDDLERWTREHFPGAERRHAWSAQDYQSVNRVPFVGLMPRGGRHIYVATGFNKWGMTNAVAAALNVSGHILGGSMPWAEKLGHRVTKPAGILSAVVPNAEVAVELAKDWVSAELHALPEGAPDEGAGVVGRGEHGMPEGISTVDGITCRVSALCTHLGGVLRWNDAERSWDCPLHGSRFAANGTRLEGPAVDDLKHLS